MTLNKKLDYETATTHTITVRATDKGTNPLDSSGNDATITVTVLDENDNKPEFENLNFEISVPEDRDVLSVLYTVSATDKDDNLNGMVTYSLDSGNANVFFVNPVSTNIST